MTRAGSALLRDLAMVLVWTALAVLAGAVAWSAVSRLGQTSGAASGRPLGQGEVLQALQRAGAPASAPPPRTPAPRRAAGSPTRSWRTTGGTVAASCRGTAVELVYAAPADGWAYRLETGRRVLAVDFTRPGARARLAVQCTGGEPERVPTAPPTRQPAQPGDDGGGEDFGD